MMNHLDHRIQPQVAATAAPDRRVIIQFSQLSGPVPRCYPRPASSQLQGLVADRDAFGTQFFRFVAILITDHGGSLPTQHVPVRPRFSMREGGARRRSRSVRCLEAHETMGME